MAEKRRKIQINAQAPAAPDNTDDSFEAADAVPVVMDEQDDEATGRQPIDLDAPVTDTPPPAEAPAVPSADLAAMQEQVALANDKYLRTLAEFQNYRRRTDEDITRRVREGNEKLLQQLLPVLDDFNLAIAHAKQSQSFEQLIGGVEATGRKFRETLEKQGVMPINALGEKFDPDLHEAVMLDEDSDAPDETVTAELRTGYTLHNRVIRPSLVKVAKTG